MKRWQWVVWLLGIGVLAMSCQTESEGNFTAIPRTTLAIPPLPALMPEEVDLGEQVYITHCASCHGANLEGEANWQEQNDDGSFRAPPHDVSGHTWHHPDNSLFESVERGGARFEGMNVGGTSNMPAFGEILADEEIRAVLTYIKSTWPGETRAAQWEVTVVTENQ